jgi:hypothetical protein
MMITFSSFPSELQFGSEKLRAVPSLLSIFRKLFILNNMKEVTGSILIRFPKVLPNNKCRRDGNLKQKINQHIKLYKINGWISMI